MRVADKYLNPFTDFGFKKLFEQAEIANFDEAKYSEYEEKKSRNYNLDLEVKPGGDADQGMSGRTIFRPIKRPGRYR